MTTDTHVVEACRACGTRVRVLQEKLAAARCPKCKGLLGDPKLDHPCGGCGAVNRVLRSRLSQARCGRCKEPLFKDGEVPREYVLAEADGLVQRLFADDRLVGRHARPRDVAETIDLFKAMPQAIAELAARLPAGEDRDGLSAASASCKRLAEQLRPLAFESAAVLGSDELVGAFMLGEAFEAMRRHAAGFEALKAIRRGDYGLGGARSELAATGPLFERLIDRVHKTDWNDMDGDRARRQELADRLFGELSRVIESWLIRPYKLEAMVNSAMSRLGDLPGGAEALAQHQAVLREDVTVFLAIATAVLARGTALHGLGATAKDVWPILSGPLRGAALASA